MIRVTPSASPAGNPRILSDIKIRYAVRNTRTEEVGSAMKRLEVVNQGDVPCRRPYPCSPNGKWRAAIGGVKTLRCGSTGSEFHNARATCIAGPCPFTKIEKDGFSAGGRSISVTVRNWSDTVSFVLEADVTRSENNEMVRQAFAVLVNQVLSFVRYLRRGSGIPQLKRDPRWNGHRLSSRAYARIILGRLQRDRREGCHQAGALRTQAGIPVSRFNAVTSERCKSVTGNATP